VTRQRFGAFIRDVFCSGTSPARPGLLELGARQLVLGTSVGPSANDGAFAPLSHTASGRLTVRRALGQWIVVKPGVAGLSG